MMKQMRSNNGGNNIACNVNDGTSPPAAGQEWAISTKLRDGTLWCIDNSGSAKVGATAANGKCP